MRFWRCKFCYDKIFRGSRTGPEDFRTFIYSMQKTGKKNWKKTGQDSVTKNSNISSANDEISDTESVSEQKTEPKKLDDFSQNFDIINAEDDWEITSMSDTESVSEQKTGQKKLGKHTKHFCEYCNFSSNDNNDYKRHLNTKKHIRMVNDEVSNEQDKHYKFRCNCGNSYVSKLSLKRHKERCDQPGGSIMEQFNSQFQSIFNVMTAFMNAQTASQATQSALMMEQTKALMDVIKTTNTVLAVPNGQQNSNSNNRISNTITNNTQINDNKSFNLNVFLNETCKNAINLTDFIDEIFVTIADLERTGELGYVGGISALFIDRLNELEQEDRPMHCSDSKRASLFVRNNNRWEKEEIARQLLTKAIKQLALKSMKKIVEWQKLHPDYNNPESKQNDQYNLIMMNSMSGGTKEESESNYEKIFNNVVKNVVIDKKSIKGK